MDEYHVLLRRIKALRGLTAPWEGVVYRNTSVRYARSSDLLGGEGSSQAGGRWNPRGLRAVYASLTPETAMAETLNHFRRYGWDIVDAMPRVFVAVRVVLGVTLDLNDGEIRRRLRVSLRRMLADDWREVQWAGKESVTQMLGAAAVASGIEAVLVPSSTGGGARNIVWFPDNLSSRCRTVICNEDELP